MFFTIGSYVQGPGGNQRQKSELFWGLSSLIQVIRLHFFVVWCGKRSSEAMNLRSWGDMGGVGEKKWGNTANIVLIHKVLKNK